MDLVGYDKDTLRPHHVGDYRAFARQHRHHHYHADPDVGPLQGRQHHRALRQHALVQRAGADRASRDRRASTAPTRPRSRSACRCNGSTARTSISAAFAGQHLRRRSKSGDAVVHRGRGARRSHVDRIVTYDGDLQPTAAAGHAVTTDTGRRGRLARAATVSAADPTSPPEVADQFEATLVWMADEADDRGPPLSGSSSTTQTRRRRSSRRPSTRSTSTPSTITRPRRSTSTASASAKLSHRQRRSPFEAYERQPHTLGGFILIDKLTNATVAAGMLALHPAPRRTTSTGRRSTIDKADARANLKNQRPRSLWFTGLSGAGKSTIANLVEKKLHAAGPPHLPARRRQCPPRAQPRPRLHRGRPHREHPPRRRGRRS